MATKSKIFNPFLRLTAFILITALSTIMAIKLISLQKSDMWVWHVDDVGKTEYTETNSYHWRYVQTANYHFKELTAVVAGRTPSEAEILTDELFSDVEWSLKLKLFNEYADDELTRDVIRNVFEIDYKNQIDEQINNIFVEFYDEIRETLLNRGFTNDEITYERIWDVFESDYSARISDAKERFFVGYEWAIKEEMIAAWADENLTREKLRAAFETEYEAEIANIRQNSASSVNERIDAINQNFEGIIYYIKAGDFEAQNSPLGFEEIRQKQGASVYLGEDADSRDIKEEAFYAFAFSDDFLAAQNARLLALNEEVRELLIFAAVWLAFYTACAIYLICAAGRLKPAEANTKIPAEADIKADVKTNPLDKLLGEIILALIALSVFGGALWTYYLYHLHDNAILKYVYFGVLTLFFAFLYAMFALLIGQIKDRRLLKNSLILMTVKFIFRLFIKILDGIINVFKACGGGLSFLFSKRNPMFKVTFVILGLGLLTMIPFVGFITVPVALIIIYRQVRAFKIIDDGLQAVRSGSYQEPVEVTGNAEFKRLARNINEIAAGLNEEVNRRTKSERFKTELIINVSHDLRTPLTSLITYSDLLKNEQTDNENITKYAEIISQKSLRLKSLTDDLFESAKAASGNITVCIDNVDINSLLIQALAEFDDKIKKSNLDFKLNIPEKEGKIIALADGKLLWRVIENLMSNALKYSLENSRVYIDVYSDNGFVTIEMKNISKAELNIPEDEVTERFKRGDLSRNSEGSGLGLDIASSLTRCQNGELSIKIDGDLFKARVKIPKGGGG